jgi:hypothetical protein
MTRSDFDLASANPAAPPAAGFFLETAMRTLSASLVTQNRRHAFSARGCDCYETPPEATRALLKAEQLPRRIWEPACGRGAIVNVLRSAGHDVVASDIMNYDIPITSPTYWCRDFLLESAAPAGTQCVLTNPPYRSAAAFVRHALKLCPRAIFLLRLSFLESIGRTDILEGGKLAKVFIFRNRLPFMHRDGWTGPRATSAIPFGWFCWDASHVGPAAIHRISWER